MHAGKAAAVIASVLIAFTIFLYGVIALGWDFDSEAAADMSQIGPPKSGGAPLIIRFGTTVAWTPRTFEAASARMLGHILSLTYTDTPGQLMTNPEHTTLETFL